MLTWGRVKLRILAFKMGPFVKLGFGFKFRDSPAAVGTARVAVLLRSLDLPSIVFETQTLRGERQKKNTHIETERLGTAPP